MGSSAVPGKISETCHVHTGLTRAHQDAIRASRTLHESLSQLRKIDLADLTNRSIEVARALQQVAKAERDCGFTSGGYFRVKLQQEMLRQQRLAYMKFELLSSELQDNSSPIFTDLLRSAADIQHHIELAELAHQVTVSRKPQHASTVWKAE